MGKKEAELWSMGNDIEKEFNVHGFVILKHKKGFIGCGRQYRDELEAHRAGRRQERQWQLEGQDYVTQTPNIAERVNQTLTKIVTNPLNEIKYGYQQLYQKNYGMQESVETL